MNTETIFHTLFYIWVIVAAGFLSYAFATQSVTSARAQVCVSRGGLPVTLYGTAGFTCIKAEALK